MNCCIKSVLPVAYIALSAMSSSCADRSCADHSCNGQVVTFSCAVELLIIAALHSGVVPGFKITLSVCKNY